MKTKTRDRRSTSMKKQCAGLSKMASNVHGVSSSEDTMISKAKDSKKRFVAWGFRLPIFSGGRNLQDGWIQRLVLLEAWKSLEEARGDEESRAKVEEMMPQVVKKRRKIDDGTVEEVRLSLSMCCLKELQADIYFLGSVCFFYLFRSLREFVSESLLTGIVISDFDLLFKDVRVILPCSSKRCRPLMRLRGILRTKTRRLGVRSNCFKWHRHGNRSRRRLRWRLARATARRRDDDVRCVEKKGPVLQVAAVNWRLSVCEQGSNNEKEIVLRFQGSSMSTTALSILNEGSQSTFPSSDVPRANMAPLRRDRCYAPLPPLSASAMDA
jgi:hypothetical protein